MKKVSLCHENWEAASQLGMAKAGLFPFLDAGIYEICEAVHSGTSTVVVIKLFTLLRLSQDNGSLVQSNSVHTSLVSSYPVQYKLSMVINT